MTVAPPRQQKASKRHLKASQKLLQFTDYYHLNKRQSELDFIDIPLDTDSLVCRSVRLTVAGDDNLRNCGDVLVEYFKLLLAAIKNKDENTALGLLSNLLFL